MLPFILSYRDRLNALVLWSYVKNFRRLSGRPSLLHGRGCLKSWVDVCLRLSRFFPRHSFCIRAVRAGGIFQRLFCMQCSDCAPRVAVTNNITITIQ